MSTEVLILLACIGGSGLLSIALSKLLTARRQRANQRGTAMPLIEMGLTLHEAEPHRLRATGTWAGRMLFVDVVRVNDTDSLRPITRLSLSGEGSAPHTWIRSWSGPEDGPLHAGGLQRVLSGRDDFDAAFSVYAATPAGESIWRDHERTQRALQLGAAGSPATKTVTVQLRSGNVEVERHERYRLISLESHGGAATLTLWGDEWPRETLTAALELMTGLLESGRASS